jgi:hypothetical protein
MRQVSIHRHPGLFIVGLVELLVLHFVLCYPAAISRGWPPLEPFWLVAIYLPFLGVALLPAFDDFSYAPRIRRLSLLAFCVASSIILGAAAANLSDIRPHHGHLVGYVGLLRDSWVDVLVHGTLCFVVVLPFVFCWYSISRTIWDHVRCFANPIPTRARVNDLLLIVASVGLLCGIVRLVVRLGPYYFSRPLLSG